MADQDVTLVLPQSTKITWQEITPFPLMKSGTISEPAIPGSKSRQSQPALEPSCLQVRER